MKAESHSHAIGCCDHADRSGRLSWLFTGSAFVIAAYAGDLLYPDNPMAAEISAVIGALLLAAPIVWSAVRDLFRGELHMDAPVAIAVLSALALGDFRTAGIVAFFMLLALVIETQTAKGAHGAIEALIRLTPAMARRILPAGKSEEIPASALVVGDRIRLLPGDSVPADGELILGQTTLNEATITGESIPRDKGPGDQVFAGTQNLTGAVEVRVSRIGEETALGKVRELILAAEQTKLPITRIIDQYLRYYIPVVLTLAAAVWFFTGDWNRVIAMLVVSCPCALILATPTAMVAALAAAARNGILVKNVSDLEGAARINAVIFDKTGTLTLGELGVARLAPVADISPSDLLEWSGTAEKFSKHPVAVALRKLAEQTGLLLGDPESMEETAGRGVTAQVAGSLVQCGRASWLRELGIQDPRLDAAESGDSAVYSTLFVAKDGQYVGWIGLEDQVRPEAAPALRGLVDLNIRKIAMISGDREVVTRMIADRIGCPEVQAECLPAQKVDYVRHIHAQGYRTAFIGDGVNDAPALAAGDLGIAMGAAGNDIAIHSATVALMNNDLMRIPYLIRLSRDARAAVYQNLAVAGLFILGGLILSGISWLPPVPAAIAHNLGSLIVVFNSARLIRIEHAQTEKTP
ncbi:MAG: cation-translocating P-type ATPase [Verrucomicrobia bacterium]|nr:cation-translocating P-type ATPase [Verrucomicrobiota bacterium]